MKILKRLEIDEVYFNNSSDRGNDYVMKYFRNCTIETYSFVLNEGTLSSNHPLRFWKKSNTKSCFIKNIKRNHNNA